MSKSYIKSKSAPNAAGPKYRTPDHFTPQSRFGKSENVKKNSSKKINKPQVKFNPGQFKVQHKG